MPRSAPEVEEVEEGFSSVVVAAGQTKSALVCLGEKEKKGKRFPGKQEEFMGLWAAEGPWLIAARRVSGRHRRAQLGLPNGGSRVVVLSGTVLGDPRVLNHTRLPALLATTLLFCVLDRRRHEGLPSW